MRKWVLASLVFSCGILLRLPAFTRALLSDDEAIYATTAAAMARGELLYRDVVDHKPPLIYHVYQAGFSLFGAFNTQGAHLLVLLAVLATGGLLWKLAQRGVRDGANGAVAAFLFLVFSTTWHDYDALAANCELFLLVPQTAAAWLLLRVVDSGETQRTRVALDHLAIGLLVGCSALFKYQGLTFLGVSAGLLGWAAVTRRLSFARAVSAIFVEGLAALVPAGIYLAICLASGNAADAIYWFAFNFSYLGAGLSGLLALWQALWRLGLIGGIAIIPYGFGLWAAVRAIKALVRAIRAPDRAARLAVQQPGTLLALLWLVTSAVAVSAGGRFFGHYFHLLLPALSLLAAPRVLALWRRGRAMRLLLSVLCAGPALVFFLLATVARPLAERWDEGEPPYESVSRRMVALTGPGDRVFVWGNSPQLYVLARRPLGARFTFCNYMTGESPGTPTESGGWDADASSLPESWDMLFADLETRRPLLFVDAAAAGWDGYDKFPLARYPRLAAYVAAHYIVAETTSGVVLYRRKS